MKKRRSIRLGVRDFLIPIICVILCLSCLTVYFSDMIIGVQRNRQSAAGFIVAGSEAIVGNCVFLRGTVTRTDQTSGNSENIAHGTSIYSGDTITTKPDSEAFIVFSSNDTLILGEESKVRVFVSDSDGAEINFESGIMSADSRSSKNGLTVHSGEVTVDLDAKSLLSAEIFEDTEVKSGAPGGGRRRGSLRNIGSTRRIVYHMVNGNGILWNGGQRSDISAGWSAAVSESSVAGISNIDVNQRMLTLTSPKFCENVMYEGGNHLSVNFSWRLRNPPEGAYVLIETSPVKRFTVVNESIKVSRTNVRSANVDVPLGTTFYRVRLMGADDDPLEEPYTGRISVIYPSPPELVVPGPGDVFYYRNKPPVMYFNWVGNALATNYILEISDKEDMTDPVVTVETDQVTEAVSALDKGTWYWRVTEDYSEAVSGENPVSEVSSFVVRQRDELDSPVLRMPAAGALVDISSGRGTIFSWDASDEAVSYDLCISATPEGDDILARITRSENYASINPTYYRLYSGSDYYWYVTQTDSEGTSSRRGEVRRFHVTGTGGTEFRALSPANDAAIPFSDITGTKFTWKSSVPGEVNIVVATDRAFTDVVFSKSAQGDTGETTGIVLPPGRYWWRITNHQLLTGETYTSDANSFSVAPPPGDAE